MRGVEEGHHPKSLFMPNCWTSRYQLAIHWVIIGPCSLAFDDDDDDEKPENHFPPREIFLSGTMVENDCAMKAHFFKKITMHLNIVLD